MKRSKPQNFKNPFDFELNEEDDETLPIQPAYQEPHRTVHNPLPFNPYTVADSPPKTIQPLNKPTRIAQPFVPESQPMSHPTTTTFNPQEVANTHEERSYELNEDGDPPLLEDIGIDMGLIVKRMKMVLRLGKPENDMVEDADLSGPIIIALCFGVLLLLSGKVHFGDIYAIFVVGNILMYFLFNFMSQIDVIPLYSIMSTVGYALLPMLLLGFFGIFSSLKGNIGIIISLAVSGWASLAASNIIESLMRQTESNRKPLLIYPLFLFYVSFAMIIIF